jgi:RimJ/RimL family protein N-acetyltransferase
VHLFRGRLLRLAAPDTSDDVVVRRWSDDAEFLRRLQLSHVRPFRLDEIPHTYLGGSSGTNHIHFRLRTLADDRLVGYVVLYDIHWNLQVASLGIAIGDPADRGRGYGRDGMELILRYAFHELNMHRIALTVLARNTSARHLYERVGFQVEGIMRDNDFRDGVRTM